MTGKLENIKRVMSNYVDINEDEWHNFSSKFIVKEFKKKKVIQNYGDICKYLYFVEKGILRVFFIDDEGDEKTFHFAFKDTFTADYESFLKQIPSNYIIQAIEDVTLIQIPLDALHFAYKNLRYGERLGRLLAEEYIFVFTKKTKAIYTKTPLQRYQSFKKMFPDVFQRVPQHYIASYLNISPVHLSRLIHQTNQNSGS